MPRSRRNKLVALTKTKEKGKSLKTALIDTLRNTLDEYHAVFVIQLENRRSDVMRQVRMDWKESKLFMGKNSVAQIALGKTIEDEYQPNLRQISKVKPSFINE